MLVVVGGHSRNIGKTAVTAGIIAALSDMQWTAMKITQYGHGVCSSGGGPCECATDSEHPFAIREEIDVRTGHDTARYLAAGAVRSLWVRTKIGELGHAVPSLRRVIETGGNVIAESNSLLQFFKPDLYLVVLDFAVADFKDSALRYLDRADALIVLNGSRGEPAWSGVLRRLWEAKKRFPAAPPHYVTPELARFVQAAAH